MSTSAMPLMPMPPMPTKWIGPISLGSFMLSCPVYLPRITLTRRAANSWRCCHAQHQIRQPLGEERRDFGCDLGPGIDVRDPGEVLLARLLHHREARSHIAPESLDGERHDVGHDPRALAAAEDEQAYRPRRLRSGIGRGR